MKDVIGLAGAMVGYLALMLGLWNVIDLNNPWGWVPVACGAVLLVLTFGWAEPWRRTWHK